MNNPSQSTSLPLRNLAWWEIRRLEHRNCRALDWQKIFVTDQTDLSLINNVEFRGYARIGRLCRADREDAMLRDATLENVSIGDDPKIASVRALIRNTNIGARVTVVDIGRIDFDLEAQCGIGTPVAVLDETGSRQVRIFPGISAQTAMLIARDPQWAETHLGTDISDLLLGYSVEPAIGDDAFIVGCGSLKNVAVGNEVAIEGAASLKNGVVINNATHGKCIAGIGQGVDAENFIIEDGYVGCNSIIRNCYVGQGVVIDKGFSAHDSLFFANAAMENGEACALFAGPFTVSMHKSSLLIGCQTSFMNAGSGTNQSNHMYKLGPIHWGLLERGVKTSSDSYLMLGAKIGAFSLLMGQHKTHPDSSQFPFSYLFGDDRGATVVVPAAMLRSCGLLRDEKKWPTRDRRLRRKLPLHDRIIYDVLNPLTVSTMLSALEVIASLLSRPADDDHYLRYKGMKLTRASLERARHLYTLAIYKYLSINYSPSDETLPPPPLPAGLQKETSDSEWIDMAGLLMPRSYLDRIKQQDSIARVEEIFNEAFENYPLLQKQWIAGRFTGDWLNPEAIRIYSAEFDRIVEEDRRQSREALSQEEEMLRL